MSNIVKEISLPENKTLEIQYADTHGLDPRKDDNLTKMVCFHGSYDLGDEHDYNQDDHKSWEELKAAIEEKENPLVILPLYLYNHSGITINTTGFSCQWDSGQVGWVYITNKQIDLCGTTINDGETFSEYKERLKTYLLGEVNLYDQFITGDVYSFEIKNEDGDVEDSCTGFYGTDWKTNGISDYVPEEALDQL